MESEGKVGFVVALLGTAEFQEATKANSSTVSFLCVLLPPEKNASFSFCIFWVDVRSVHYLPTSLFGFDIIDKVTNDWQTPRRRQFAFTWQHWGWWWWLSKKEYICIVGGAEKFRENWDRSAGFLLLPQKSSFPFIVFSWAKSSFDQVIRPASLISSARNLGWLGLLLSTLLPLPCDDQMIASWPKYLDNWWFITFVPI